VLAGRSENGSAEAITKLATDAGHPDLIEALGPVAHDSLADVLADADVFAAPSHQEGGPGFVYLEAMASGLATVGTRGSGVAEIIDDGVTGVLVAPRDPVGLAAALGRLLDDESERARLGAAARARVEAEFEPSRSLDRLEAFYATVVA